MKSSDIPKVTKSAAVTKPLAVSKSLTKGAGRAFAVELGVAGMPEFASDMLSGGLYALTVVSSSTRFPIFTSTIQSALNQAIPCTVITAAAPEDMIQRLESAGGFSATEWLTEKRLVVFSMQDEFSKKMFRFGADRLTQELESFEVPQSSYLIFDQADDLLSLHDLFLAAQQIKVLAQWFKQKQITGLLTFTRSTETQIAALQALLDHLNGIARLGGDRDGIEMTFVYWRSTPGVIAARNFRLYANPVGLYAVSRREVERAKSPQSGIESPVAGEHSYPASVLTEGTAIATSDFAMVMADSIANAPAPVSPDLYDGPQHFFYTDPALDFMQGALQGNPLRVDGLIELLHASLDKPKSTILVNVDRSTDLKGLAKTVHLLRKNLGAKSQIVIREKAISLSEAQKHWMLMCGANTVLVQTVALGQYAGFLNTIRHQVFSRKIKIDFEAILAEVVTDDDLFVVPVAPDPEGSHGAVSDGSVIVEAAVTEKTSVVDIPLVTSGQSYSYRAKTSDAIEPTMHRPTEKAKRSAIRVA
jgi:Cellulose biosynthesis GIL